MHSRLMALGVFPALFACTSLLQADEAPRDAVGAFRRGLELFQAASERQKQSPAAHEVWESGYRDAARSFVEAWKSGAATTEVFTNAGNAYYFARSPGEAVLFFKRALLVDPANQRARDALEHLREKLPIQAPRSGAASSITEALFFWHAGLSFQTRKVLVLVLLPLAFGLFTAALFRRRPFTTLGLCALAPGLLLLGSVLMTAWGDESRREGVLLVETEGRRGPGMLYSPSHSRPFPPGTEVRLEGAPRAGEGGSSGESWVEVRLLDGMESWVPQRSVEKVLPEGGP